MQGERGMRNFLLKLWNYSGVINRENFLSLLKKNGSAKLLDLGCDDGEFTIETSKIIGTKIVYGLDVVEEKLCKAQQRGIKIIQSDLNKELPIKDNFFDVIISNQVIEHLIDVDLFVEEIYRILKPGGYAVISTENLASWHNIFALLLGQQAFSQTISKKSHVGCRLSPHYCERTGEWAKNKGPLHNKIFAYGGLKEIFELYQFKVESLLGSGYYPMPTRSLMKIAGRIDPRHTHFITIKVKK
jgi:ubiquinone/menaquinone biosynthesis C-methylase UbiE